MKKLFISILTFMVLMNSTMPVYAFSGHFITNQNIIDVIQTENIVTSDVEKRLKSAISKVYGEKNTNEIYVNILKIIKEAREKRDPKLKQEDLSRTNDWYKDEVIYMYYEVIENA